jgi:hypothetical protein
MYEMLMGYPPFYAENPSQCCNKIVRHEEFLEFPDEIKVSKEGKGLIKKLLSNHNVRIGKNGVDEIKKDPWFNGVDWLKIFFF